jgi:regulator of sigma E protease
MEGFLAQVFGWAVMVLILSILIVVHEFGHFSVARAFGFQTPVFGIGLPFGPYKVLGHKWGTEFRAYACALGGFVAIPELGDETNAREENFGIPLKPFRKFPIWQRALVAFAGVGFNIMFAWLIYFCMLAFMGDPSSIVRVGALPPENPIAAKAGIQVNDRIMFIDSQKIETTDDIISYLGSRAETPVVFHIKRPVDPKASPTDDSVATTDVNIDVTPNHNGKVGIALESGPMKFRKLDMNPVEMVGYTTTKLIKLTSNMCQALGMLVQNIASSIVPHHGTQVPGAKPKLGVGDLHGVLAVMAIGANIANQDWSQLLLFTVYISMDLAIINLVPWPALDGFHLATMTLEALRGKPLEERAQGEVVKWGFISLLVLMAVIMVNDVRALMNGELSLKPKAKDEQKQAQPAVSQPAPAPAAK